MSQFNIVVAVVSIKKRNKKFLKPWFLWNLIFLHDVLPMQGQDLPVCCKFRTVSLVVSITMCILVIFDIESILLIALHKLKGECVLTLKQVSKHRMKLVRHV